MAEPNKPIKELMADCTISTIKDFEFEHQLLRNIGGVNIELFVLIFETSIKSPLQFSILNLAIKNFRLHQCIDDCLFNGYYEVGLQLMRSMYENILLMTYFIKNESEADKWLRGKKFKTRYIRNKLKDSTSLYSILSQIYVHANIESLMPIIKSFEGEKIEIIVYPDYSKEKAEFNLYLSILYGWINNSNLQYVFRDHLWKNEEWKNRFIEWNDIIFSYIEEKMIKQSDVKFKFKDKLPSIYDPFIDDS